MGTCYTWDEADIVWSDIELRWNDVCIALEISSGSPTNWLDALDRLEPKKKERFIELICQVKTQQTYPHEYQRRKVIREDIEITSKDVEITAKKIIEISILEKKDV